MSFLYLYYVKYVPLGTHFILNGIYNCKHKMRPKLGRISWKICSYVGSIHPVEKVGVTDHPGANGIRLEWQGYVNPTKKSYEKACFLTKTGFS